MAWPLDNLGDYNDVRIDLQKFNGNKDELYRAIGENAVNKATPELLIKGGLGGGAIVASLGLIAYVGTKVYKKWKEATNSEPAIKVAFDEMTVSTDTYEADESAEKAGAEKVDE